MGDHEKVKAKYEELVAQYPENYLAIYDLPLDTDLNTLDYYPSCGLEKRSLRNYKVGDTKWGELALKNDKLIEEEKIVVNLILDFSK